MNAIISQLVAATRSLGAVHASVQIMPAGHAAIDIQCTTKEQAAELSKLLEMPQLTATYNDRNAWWYSELGEHGYERITIVGGHHPRCQCHPGKDM